MTAASGYEGGMGEIPVFWQIPDIKSKILKPHKFVKRLTFKIMAKDQLRKYIWILDTLYHAGAEGITKKDLNEKWKRSSYNYDGSGIPDRTFIEYKKAIEDNFDITISCKVSNGYRYYIDNLSDLNSDRIKNWLLSSFAINNMIQESKRLSDRIILENIPSGNDCLMTVIQAMNDSRRLKITYKGFHHDVPHTSVVEPYCVKVFRQRWYMVDNDPGTGKKKIHALDRMLRIEITDETFIFSDSFVPSAFFHDSFGIMVDSEDLDVETIRLKVYDDFNKRKYFRLLPLHHSQKEVEVQDSYSIFEFRLYPSYDFLQEILSHGPEVEVLSPQWVRDEISYKVTEMAKLYGR